MECKDDSTTTSATSTTWNKDKDIQILVDQLLESYGDDAAHCLARLAQLLKQQIEETLHKKPLVASSSDSEQDDDPSTNKISLHNIANIVLQTMKMEPIESVTLQHAGLQVLQYTSQIGGSDSTATDHHHPVSSQEFSSTICQVMTTHAQHEAIQEAACIALCHQLETSNDTNKTADTSNDTSSYSSEVSTILFPVLQAMNWHPTNTNILEYGFRTCRQCAKMTQASHRETVVVMDLIELTGGLSIFFQALQQKPQPRTTSQSRQKERTLKQLSLDTLADLAVNNPVHQVRIAQYQPRGMTLILDTMRIHLLDEAMQETTLRLLASLAFGKESKEILLAKGGLDCILTTMDDNYQQVTIQATACRAIANIFAGTTTERRVKMGSLCIKPLLRAMRVNTNNPTIQLYGCAALRNLSASHHVVISEVGGIATLLVGISAHLERPAIQEQAWGTLYQLLSNGPREERVIAVAAERGISTLLKQVLTQYAKHPLVQQQGLACLSRLAIPQANQQEGIVSQSGFDRVLSALYTHGAMHYEIAKHSLEVLEHLTQTEDFRMALLAKNGLNLLVITLQRHPQRASVQLLGCQCFRNLSLQPDHAVHLLRHGSVISVLVSALRHHPKNHPLIPAFGSDALAHLADYPTNKRRTHENMVRANAVETVLESMSQYPDHHAVQELGCYFLSNVSQHPEAVVRMKHSNGMATLQAAMTMLPRNGGKPTARALIQHLQSSRALLQRNWSTSKK